MAGGYIRYTLIEGTKKTKLGSQGGNFTECKSKYIDILRGQVVKSSYLANRDYNDLVLVELFANRHGLRKLRGSYLFVKQGSIKLSDVLKCHGCNIRCTEEKVNNFVLVCADCHRKDCSDYILGGCNSCKELNCDLREGGN